MPQSFAQDIFQKPIDHITQEDLITYFQQERDETLFLEFKSFTEKSVDQRDKQTKDSEKIKGILKTINAFLNSSGGLLIWGAPEPVEVSRGKKKVKMCQGPLSPILEFYDRDAFINRIASHINPIAPGIRMQPVPVEGGYVYLFDVPESENKPHQYDGRYYVRMDTRTDAAPHYLVYALCRQVKFPRLEIEIVCNDFSVNTLVKTYVPVEISAIITNTTPFVNDTDIYAIGKTDTCFFSDKKGQLVRDFHVSEIAKILPLGLRVIANLQLLIPLNFLDNRPTFEIWYGGRQSNVTQAKFALDIKSKGLNKPESQYHHYTVYAEILEERRVDDLANPMIQTI